MTSSNRPLSGKVALVTGSARRIGRESALLLAREGAHVVVHARSSRDEIEAVAAEIRAEGGAATALLADITVEAEVQRLVDAILGETGRLDILVNNAAVRGEKPLVELDLATFRAVYSVIVEGAFLVTRAAVPAMARNGFGRIISIGGVSAHSGVSHRVHVATAKAALVGFTKALAIEFGAQGITANLVVPGRIGGPRSATSGAGGAFPGGGFLPVGHEGAPRNVAEIVRTLALPSGDFITGQTLHVNGGMYLP
ncbi:3-oxoacyl-[acyl-carrier protein] reductase [Ancylobacter sp. 3268]|uniref:SDR family NAD(P)-dependent oxidoreductase n=1 Tax=Ancylobacter sp. 3268 TaxID=2817752 RepID=UPI00285F9D88|nr:SDR family oxidoreductase [Ancylobacter sp. 3268]MDR6952537.1 3-oxoacyl-[acyl-carrier protein] reductase [Ancylobacter sp. 3268]